MAKHIRSLGLADPAAYARWCAANGFEPSLDKSPAERELELERPAANAEGERRRQRVHANPRRFIELVCAGELRPDEATRPGWREAALAIDRVKDPEARASLQAFLLHVEGVSDLVFASTTVNRQPTLYIDALIRLHERRGQWMRTADSWKPDTHNSGRQFASLANHLLARYSAPGFMTSVWLRGDRGAHRYRDWFAHVGRGGNIRTARTPYPMTRMIAHNFHNAPDDCSIESALMLADVLALGGSRRLADALMGTRLGARVESDPDRRAFWLSVYRFFIDNPLLDLRHVGPIVDYLAHHKFEPQRLAGPGGAIIEGPPPQPSLSMLRRTPDTLLRQVEVWHGRLRKTAGADGKIWRPSGYRDLVFETGPASRPAERTTWRFTELLTGAALVEEGRQLRHCIATYASSCEKGQFSVWSLARQAAFSSPEKVLTIAVDRSGAVVEARGARNRMPEAAERNHLDIWMTHAGLRPGPYLWR